MGISIKRVYQYMVIFLNFYTTSNHLHPLQVGNCDSNSRLVVDEDDNGKFRTERVKLNAKAFNLKGRISFVSERVNPLIAKLFNLNFHPLEVVSR